MSVHSEPLFHIYRALASAAGFCAPAILAWRLSKGREDRKRLRERMAFPGLPRPEGRLVWMHGASVGEGLTLLPIVERMIERGFHVLVTTGTVASAGIMAERLPPKGFHQYMPLDAPAFTRRFLDYWRPDLVLFAESELWPNFLFEANKRSIPLLLVNARLSPRSFKRWSKLPGFIGPMLARIDLVLAQSQADGARIAMLGAPRVRAAGNLKYDVPPPPVDPIGLADMTAAIGSRPVWLAASTHPLEEAVVIEAHLELSRGQPGLLTIIAPRHTQRGADIAAQAAARGIKAAVRSRGDQITPETAFYIADTMGELGLFYRLAAVVFVGKSMGGETGGHNPIEPAKLGAAVLRGPDVGNFLEIYDAIDTAHGSALVGDAATLARALAMLLADPAKTRAMARAAGGAVARLGGATDHVMQALEPYMMQMQAERR